MHSTIVRNSTRAVSLRQPLTTWADEAAILGMGPEMLDHPIENPNLLSPGVDPDAYPDDRQFRGIEANSSVYGAMMFRIATLQSGGWSLSPGTGPGAEIFHELWDWWLQELPVSDILRATHMSVFRGWTVFENRLVNVEWKDGQGSPTLMMPGSTIPALSWQFRWTARRDLIYQPNGVVGSKLWRMQNLSSQMKWFTPSVGSQNPYGDPLHGFWGHMDFVARQLQDSGMSQIHRAQGFLKATGGGADLSDPAKEREIQNSLAEIANDFRVTGILDVPDGRGVEWIQNTAAVFGWVAMYEYMDKLAASLYAGSPLVTNPTGEASSRSSGEVGERVVRQIAESDAMGIEDEIRRGYFLPWSTANASILVPEFRHLGLRPNMGDVPISAMPRLEFKSLGRVTAENLAFAVALKKLGVEGENGEDVKIGIERALEQNNWNVMEKGQKGATVSLAKEEPPPMITGQMNLPGMGPQRGADPSKNRGLRDPRRQVRDR